MLVIVDAPHFYAAMEMEHEKVVRAAPILRWTVGKKRQFLAPYFRKKGWRAFIYNA